MNSKGSAVEGEGEAKGDIKSQVADARVIIPQREAYNNSDTAYIAYTWVDVFAQRRVDLDAELSKQVPAPFERLQESILSFRHSEGEGEGAQDPGQPEARDDGGSGIGFFVVYTGSRDWIPEEIRQRAKVRGVLRHGNFGYNDKCLLFFSCSCFADSSASHR